MLAAHDPGHYLDERLVVTQAYGIGLGGGGIAGLIFQVLGRRIPLEFVDENPARVKATTVDCGPLQPR